MTDMRVLLTGAAGQLGTAIRARRPSGVTLTAVDAAALDITDAELVRATVDSVRPDVIINAAAYTAVDRAESERDLAFRVNSDGAGNVAGAAANTGARLIHISTDFVFDGSQRAPYEPTATTNPISVYGESKLAGEQAVTDRSEGRALIIRTSWLYSGHGRNFVRTMLRLMQRPEPVRVVDDQVGSPTWARGLADAIWAAATLPGAAGVMHWADAGAASWHDVAAAIAADGAALGLVPASVHVDPISTSAYPTAARRPAYSVLGTSAAEGLIGVVPRPWRTNLRQMLEDECRAA